jgi:hypothetical protein
MRNLLVSLAVASILTTSNLAAADEPARPSGPVAPPAAAPLGQAEHHPVILTEPRIRSRGLVYGGIGATAGGAALLTYGIWALSQPVTPCPTFSRENAAAAVLAVSGAVACGLGEGAGQALRIGGYFGTIAGGLAMTAGVTMIVLGARPARAAAEPARLPAPTLSLGPRSAALRWTF